MTGRHIYSCLLSQGQPRLSPVGKGKWDWKSAAAVTVRCRKNSFGGASRKVPRH